MLGWYVAGLHSMCQRHNVSLKSFQCKAVPIAPYHIRRCPGVHVHVYLWANLEWKKQVRVGSALHAY